RAPACTPCQGPGPAGAGAARGNDAGRTRGAARPVADGRTGRRDAPPLRPAHDRAAGERPPDIGR
ncbi:hypothetical protein MNEG_5655, partial [Monoraphidium neglectum]